MVGSPGTIGLIQTWDYVGIQLGHARNPSRKSRFLKEQTTIKIVGVFHTIGSQICIVGKMSEILSGNSLTTKFAKCAKDLVFCVSALGRASVLASPNSRRSTINSQPLAAPERVGGGLATPELPGGGSTLN